MTSGARGGATLAFLIGCGAIAACDDDPATQPDASLDGGDDAGADSGDAQGGDADPDAGEPQWEFDVAALLAGAASDVPDEVLAAYPAILGGSLTHHTAITGIEFHIPGVISSEELSPTPIPIRREVNGTAFWQVSGELSARLTDDLGVYWVIGPIDQAGVSHRDETYDSFEPTEEEPDEPHSHPRAGLPGAFFVVRWPVEGFNGSIIQHQAPNDGGSDFPQAPLAWMSVDALALLSEGYALVSVGAGGTVYARKNGDGTETIDTNPESGSGIFWTEDELWTDGGILETERTRLVPYMRVADIDPDADFAEAAHPAVTMRQLWVPEEDPETGDVGMFIEDNFTNPDFWIPPHWLVPDFIGDASVVFQNLLAQATGETELWTVYLGWSGSGAPAWQIVTGKQSNGTYAVDRAMGEAPNGGNFHEWREPESGRRFDAFVVFAGVIPWPWFADDVNNVEQAERSAGVDPEYPLGAPYVMIHGDADGTVPQVFGYSQANALAAAWETSQLADEPLEDWFTILSLERVNHQAWDQLFTIRDLPPYDGALWFDPALGYDPSALNTEQRGQRMTEEYARMHALNGSELQFFATDLHAFPRLTPFYVALFETLRERTENGGPMPASRVDPDVFEHLDDIDESTTFPRYDVPCEVDFESEWEEHLACRDGLAGDAISWAFPLSATDLAAVRAFAADNPLPRSTEPLLLPDVAAPLGFYYFVWGTQLRRDFTEAELIERYADHDGYVAAWSAAAEALTADGLWDPELGELYLDAVRASSVLRDE